MATGLSRRAATETNADRSLRSMATIKPVSLPQTAGPASAPRLPNAQVTTSYASRLSESLGEYGQEVLGQAAKREQELRLMDGQMAAQQGKTFQEVQMGGDKWALEGYRLVEAQQLSSALLTAQRQEIAEGAYESDPDAYRARVMNRVDGVLAGASDDRTRQLAKEQFLKQIPVLVDDHMKSHLQWKEQKNFETLTRSIDTVSMDPTSAPALIAFATGEATVDESKWSGPIPFDPKKHKPKDIGLGGPSTEYLMTMEVDGKWVNIPSIWWDKNGNPVKMDEETAMKTAEAYAGKTGARFPEFDSEKEAVDWAKKRSAAGGAEKQRIVRGAESPTAGLSESRRREAVTAGIVNAFQNDNPQAYAILGNSGVLNDLTVPQRQAVDAARKQFEQRRRTEYDAEFVRAEQDLLERISKGEFVEPQMAVEAYAELLKEHDITISQQEAGTIYTGARDGARAAQQADRVRTSALVQDNLVRGDRQTAIDLIEHSLIGTESGGNTAAFRTNKDGRSYAGLIQFGAARLSEVNAGLGTNYTLDDVRGMSKEEQKVLADWHFGDILDHIEAKGYGNLVGQQINGVEVTISGLAAVAHLGGKTGLDKFVSSNGAYNPQDEEKTSLTDYLRKHGTGVLMDPAAIQRNTADRIEKMRTQAGIAQYEAATPLLQQADEEFLQTGDRVKWEATRAQIMQQFNIEKTLELAKSAVATQQKWRESVLKDTEKATDDANKEAENQRKVAAHADGLIAENTFKGVLDRFEKGEATLAELTAAQNQLNADRAAIQQRYNLPTDVGAEEASLNAQVRNIEEAIDARLKWQEDGVSIRAAMQSGTVGELSRDLQDRAIKDARDNAMQNVQNAISSGAIPQSEGAAMFTEQMTKFYAQSGVVDPQLERTMNGFLSGGMLQKDGTVRQEYVEAAQQYRDLSVMNPALADKYVRKENRAELDAVLDVAAGGPIDGAVRTIGTRKSSALRIPTRDEFMKNPDTIAAVNEAIDMHFRREDIGLGQIMSPSRNATFDQRMDTAFFNEWDEVNTKYIKDEVQAQLLRDYAANPTLKTSELVAGAVRRVTDHTPMLGGTIVKLPMDGPGAGELFFGARAPDFTDKDGVFNTALMQYFRSPEFQAVYPETGSIDAREMLPNWVPDTLLGIPLRGGVSPKEHQMQVTATGVRPFTVYPKPDGGMAVIFSSPTGGYTDAIDLDLRAVGDRYIKEHTANAARK